MSLVWLNGHLCESAQAHVSLADRGLTLGDGLFETLRVQNGRVCHLDLHMQRLQHGGAVLGLAVPSAAMVAQAAQALLQAAGVQNGSARLTVTRGVAPRGLLPPQQGEPTVFMTVTAGEAKVSSVSLMTSQTIRRDEQSPLNCLKSLNYLPNILARQEAARAGCDEALLLNVRGRVAETTISTVVIQEGNAFFTPSVGEGALPGVARAVLLQTGLLREEPLSLARLKAADGLYLINSLSMRQVTAFDGVSVRQCPAGLSRLCAALDISLPASEGV
ncbi:aminotransferase [Acetobacter malorum DSM 14337]|uniref:Probable branched-chain-amino-acid aminotransferase n=1 Tax=Acetobacter malorum DSM 14337 TaxID=1307910 RepID=A0ABQ0PL97_9PROT|nr:aminotransferase class IV [Acetobacter malorum]KXV08975.1 aminotransferase [Acetobacter malorum]GBQ75134.1 aminotransferase [Acetobacter malorum DSM 14337]